MHAFINELERPIGTYLYGRKMYETMASWETPDAIPDRTLEGFNSCPADPLPGAGSWDVRSPEALGYYRKKLDVIPGRR